MWSSGLAGTSCMASVNGDKIERKHDMANTDPGLPGSDWSTTSSSEMYARPDIDGQPTQPTWALGKEQTSGIDDIDEQTTQRDLTPIAPAQPDPAVHHG